MDYIKARSTDFRAFWRQVSRGMRLCSVVADSVWPFGLYVARLLHPWDSPGKNTGDGSYFLLQGIFPIQESNPSFLHSLLSELLGKPEVHLYFLNSPGERWGWGGPCPASSKRLSDWIWASSQNRSPRNDLNKEKKKKGQFSQKELRVKAKEVEFKKEIQSEAKKLSYGAVTRSEARSSW